MKKENLKFTKLYLEMLQDEKLKEIKFERSEEDQRPKEKNPYASIMKKRK